MRTHLFAVRGALAAALLSISASAGTTLNGVRVGAKDPAALAIFDDRAEHLRDLAHYSVDRVS